MGLYRNVTYLCLKARGFRFGLHTQRDQKRKTIWVIFDRGSCCCTDGLLLCRWTHRPSRHPWVNAAKLDTIKALNRLARSAPSLAVLQSCFSDRSVFAFWASLTNLSRVLVSHLSI